MISPTQLKELLQIEHKRDLKLTIIRSVSIVSLIIFGFAMAYYFAFEKSVEHLKGFIDFLDPEKNPSANIYKIMILVLIITSIGYFIYDVIKLIKRPVKIDEFVSKVEEGRVATNIVDHTVYKIIIPLVKLKLKLCPVTYVSIVFSQEIKSYKLPLNSSYIPEMKILLSGISSSDVSKAWHELYDGETTQTNENSELKTTEEFQKFVNTDLNSEITEIENKRAKGKKTYITYLIPTVLIILVWLGVQYGIQTGKLKIDTKTILIGFAGFFILFYAYIYLVKVLPNRNKPIEEDFATQFKTKVFNRIIQYINPNFRYVLHGHISLPEFLEMGFFENKSFKLDGNDQIIGKHSGVPFQLCDLNVNYKRNFSQEGDSPDEVFFGQVFVAKFNKSFKNDVYIIPKRVEGKIYSKSDTSLYLDNLGEKVKLEDPEFSKMFTVYSQDQIEARYILSTALMQRIKEIANANPKGKYMISFKNNRISIANNSRLNNFELSMFKSITKSNQAIKFYEELTSQIKIIDDLKLNVNIWK